MYVKKKKKKKIISTQILNLQGVFILGVGCNLQSGGCNGVRWVSQIKNKRKRGKVSKGGLWWCQNGDQVIGGLWWVTNDSRLEREKERWHGNGGASGCDQAMAMMGGVGDWGERKKEIGIFFKNCFIGLERRKPSYMSKGLFYPQL